VDTALMLTVAGFGSCAGAVYRPATIVPTVPSPPATLLTNHCTEVSKFPVPVTAAVNCCGWATCKFAVVGEIETEVIVGPCGLDVPEPPQPRRLTNEMHAAQPTQCRNGTCILPTSWFARQRTYVQTLIFCPKAPRDVSVRNSSLLALTVPRGGRVIAFYAFTAGTSNNSMQGLRQLRSGLQDLTSDKL
jgi:hypothetical protein